MDTGSLEALIEPERKGLKIPRGRGTLTKRSDSLPHFPKTRATRGLPTMDTEAPCARHISLHRNEQPTVRCFEESPKQVS